MSLIFVRGGALSKGWFGYSPGITSPEFVTAKL